jgi:hypothetical protein
MILETLLDDYSVPIHSDGMMYLKSENATDWQNRLEKISSFDFTPLCE